MGKQTKITGSCFGGDWTKQKLYIIESYLKCYATVLKNTRVRKIYIDAFAGSGQTTLKNKAKCDDSQLSIFSMLDDEPAVENNVIDGSALISLNYDFDDYYFLELDKERIDDLHSVIQEKYPEKLPKIHFINGDSNEELKKVLGAITVYDRCLMFLDPYALELKWETLEIISNSSVIDLWYLFPLNAIVRLIPKDGSALSCNEEKVNMILGCTEWQDTLYTSDTRTDMFGNEITIKDRIAFNKLIDYVVARLKSIFPYVSNCYSILRNNKNSPLFLLCFMMTNTSNKAVHLAETLVNSIKTGLDNEKWKKY